MDIILSKAAQRSYSYANICEPSGGRSRKMVAIVTGCRSFRTFRDCHTSIAFTTVGAQPNLTHTFGQMWDWFEPNLKFTHPTPGGAREDFRGSNIQKSGNVMNSPQKKKKKKNHPTPGGPCGVLGGGGKNSKVREMSCTARESIIILTPIPRCGWEF